MDFKTYKELFENYNKEYVELRTKYSSIFDYMEKLEKHLHNFDKEIIEISGCPQEYCDCSTSIDYEKGIISYFLSEDDYYSPQTIINFEIPFDEVFKIKIVDELGQYITEMFSKEGFIKKGWKENGNN